MGADFDGPNSEGSASIYQYNGTNWVLMQKLTDPTPIPMEYFGVSVSISGTYAIVGAYGDDVGSGPTQGSVFIYQFNGTSWIVMQQIDDATGLPGDFFGISVSLSDDYVIVGAANDDVASNANQAASIYQYNGTNWVLMEKIVDPTGAAQDYFGVSVSISDGYAIVGASSDDVGTNADQGSAGIYKYNGTNWVWMQKMVDPIGAALDYFGVRVSISGIYAIVGANLDDVASNTNQGSATIYQRVGAGWQKLQYLIDPGGGMDQYFGFSVAIDHTTKRFAAGAVNYANTGKVVFGKLN